ncbi:MAG: ROK family protein [Ilumatobacteraceae bacterium]|nr:ROK family protein [Ilumatobacteraceae bacterium]
MSHGHVALGIDIGGTGMKAARVDTRTGELLSDRVRIDTPQPSTPAAMAEVARELVDTLRWYGNVGVAMPTIVRHGVIRSAANIDASWIDVDAAALFGEALGHRAIVLNDADAAGIAEMRFGAGVGRAGVVLVLTFGTGIGSALFVDGHLVPNTELGHIEIDGCDAEDRAAASARRRDHLSWAKWAKRVDHYLGRLVMLLSPDLIIVGGGASKQADKWVPRLTVDVEVVPAAMANNAGIVGAALASRQGGEG